MTGVSRQSALDVGVLIFNSWGKLARGPRESRSGPLRALLPPIAASSQAGDGTGGPGASQEHPPDTPCEQQLGKKVLFSASTAIPAGSCWKGSCDLPSAGMDNTVTHFYAIFWAAWDDSEISSSIAALGALMRFLQKNGNLGKLKPLGFGRNGDGLLQFDRVAPNQKV